MKGVSPKTYNGDLLNPPRALASLFLDKNFCVWNWVLDDRAGGLSRRSARHFPGTRRQQRPGNLVPFRSGCADGAQGPRARHRLCAHRHGVAAVDLDKCRDPETGEIDDWAQDIIFRAAPAYVEVTVSGTGLRIIGTGTGEAAHRRFAIAGREGAKVEVYRKATRYITISCSQLGSCEALTNIDDVIDGIVTEYDKPSSNGHDPGFTFESVLEDDIDQAIKNGAPEGQRSEAFSRAVWSLAGQGQSADEIEQELRAHPDGIAAKYLRPDRLRQEIDRSLAKRQTATKAKASSHNWDDPDLSILEDRRGDLPDFPLDVLSQDWQSWAANAAHGAGTTVDHVLVPLLAVSSGLIGTARRIKPSKSWSEPFTMWTAMVGLSGTGKTPGLDVVKRALTQIEQDRRSRLGELRRAHESKAEQARAVFKTWKAAVQEAVDKGVPAPPMPADADEPPEFIEPRLQVSNSTVEKIAVLLKARPRGMLMIVDELAGLFLNLARYSSGSDREFWLEAWNGKYFVVERMSRESIAISHLLVGMCGGFQPDKLNRSFDGDADGMYTRILFSWPQEAAYQQLTDTVEEVEAEFYNVLTRLIDLPAEQEGELLISPVPLSSEAREVFEQFRKHVYGERAGLDGRDREWWAKTPAHVLRLSGTLAYLDWARRRATQPALVDEPNRIEARFVAGAVRLVLEYFWPHAQAALRQVGLRQNATQTRGGCFGGSAPAAWSRSRARKFVGRPSHGGSTPRRRRGLSTGS